MASVTVVGLGPAGPELLTAAATAAVTAIPVRFVRTRRHPAAAAVPDAVSFDEEYERAASLDQVYPRMVDRLVAAAEEHGEVVYAVPGSPRVAERSVELLASDPRVETDVVPALSFLDLVWDRLGVDPVAGGVRLVDGRRFAVEAAGERGPLVVAQCDSPAVLSEVKLAVESPPASVVVLQRLGLADEVVTEVAWDDLDRSVVPDHLTSLWVPQLASPVGAELVRFTELVRTLRARCPWDREQTHTSLTRHLLEETYELLEAIEALESAVDAGEDDAVDAAYEHLEEELGDVLFQVLFHATLGAEAGRFDVADVARGIHDKLVHRHPHVFAGVEVTGAEDVVRNWERLKADEKGRASVMDGVPANLPSLLYAFKVQRKAEALGVEVRAPDTLRLSDVATPADLGQALFATVAAARRLRLDPEAALRAAAATFRDDVASREAGALGEGGGHMG
ncbi:MAG: SAM-dependent methyltransferase [Actinomycetota bacterium]|nr:SAM-dependent methyltransferase [Actinomycetota bacterium]